MAMHAANRNREHLMVKFAELLQDLSPNGLAKLLWNNDRLTADALAVFMQPRMFAFRRRVLVVARRVDLVVFGAKGARVAGEPAIACADDAMSPAHSRF